MAVPDAGLALRRSAVDRRVGALRDLHGEFGSYNKTWGALSAVIVMLTWLWLTAIALLLGAEINAEVERTADQSSHASRSNPPYS